MSNELYHHGVKGQSWGVRNGPPYPLNQSGRTSLQKQRIEKYVKQGKAFTENLHQFSVGSLTTMVTLKGEKYVSGLMHGHDFDWQEVTNFTLNDGPKGWHNIAEVLPTKIGQSIYKDDAVRNGDGHLSDWALLKCNPGYGNNGTTQNCAKCTMALEIMNKYGVQVSAGRQTYPSSVDAPSFWFDNAERVDYDCNNVQEALTSYGKGSSGAIAISYPEGAGGHMMHWTVGNDGSFRIEDGQNARKFNSFDDMMDTYGGDRNSKIVTYRLDTATPNWDNLAQDGVIRDPRAGKPYNKVKNKWSGRVVDTW